MKDLLQAVSGPYMVPVYLGGLVGALLLLAFRPWFGLAAIAVLTAGYVLAKRYGGAS